MVDGFAGSVLGLDSRKGLTFSRRREAVFFAFFRARAGGIHNL